MRITGLVIAAVLLAAPPAMAGPIGSRIYPAPTAALSAEGLPAGASLIQVKTQDGLTLTGVEVAGRADRPTLLVFHGNGSSAADAVRWFAPMITQGYGLVAAEYRGYSANPGTPDEAGLAADADAFFAHARARAGGRRVLVVGHSLGSGVAFGLATRERLDALITIGAFTRLRAMAPKLARAFVPDEYRNQDKVASLDEPWFLIHGLSDDVVPASEGNALHAEASRVHAAGASFVIMGAGHRPDGVVLDAILDTIDAKVTGGTYPDPLRLPDGVKLIPFGKSTPLNP